MIDDFPIATTMFGTGHITLPLGMVGTTFNTSLAL